MICLKKESVRRVLRGLLWVLVDILVLLARGIVSRKQRLKLIGKIMLPALIAAGAAIGGQFIQNRMNRNAADRAYQKDLEMLKYQNEYNSPAEQMKRLQKAGLNPNLVYGSGGVTGNLTGDTPKYREEPKRFDLGTPIATGINMYQQTRQDNLAKAQEDKVLADTQLTKQQTMNAAIMNDILSTKNLKDAFDFSQYQKGADYNLEQKKLMVQKTGAEIDNLYKGMQLKDSELITKDLNRELIVANIANKVQDTKRIKEIVNAMEKGWMPGDSYLQRKIGEILNDLGLSMKDVTEVLKSSKPTFMKQLSEPNFWERFDKYSHGGGQKKFNK